MFIQKVFDLKECSVPANSSTVLGGKLFQLFIALLVNKKKKKKMCMLITKIKKCLLV